MATLPADRSKLALAQGNQVPSAVASSTKNINATTEAYDTIDLLNTKVDTHAAAAVLPHADGSVTTAKLADLGTTTAKLANSAVTTAKIADANVTTAKLADSSVTLAKMADSSVGTAELVDLAVTNAKIANGVITADKFVAGALNNETENGLQIVEIQTDITKQEIHLSNYANGDATDETTAIQAAITAAAGKTLVWTKQSGTNYMTNPLFLPSNTHIRFEPGTLVKAKTGYGATDSLFSSIDKDNIVIEGNYAIWQMLKSEYTGEQRHGFYMIGCENVVVRELIIKDCGGDGIIMGGTQTGAAKPSKNVRIINSTVDNSRRNGMSVVGNIENVIIDGCTIKNTIGTAPQAGIDIEPNSATYDNKNIIVRNCTLISNVAGIDVLNNSYDVLVTENRLYSSGAVRGYRTDIARTSPKVTFSNNRVDNITGSGIILLECMYCRVFDNFITNTTSRGIDVEGRFSIPSHSNEIYNNVIDTCTTRGISVTDNYNTRVYGNKVLNAGSNGIYVQSIAALASHNNYVYNNRIVSAANIGIDIEGSIDCVVRENIIESCTVRGISIESISDGTIVEDNLLLSCGVANTTYALALINSDNVIIRGNKIRKGLNSTLRGIDVDASSTGTIIEFNDLKDSATTDIVFSPASTIIGVNIRLGGETSPYRAASLPTAQAGYFGRNAIKSGSGVDDEWNVCIINSAAAYAWKKITIT